MGNIKLGGPIVSCDVATAGPRSGVADAVDIWVRYSRCMALIVFYKSLS